MAITFNVSSSLEQLSTLLVAELDKARSIRSSVFQPDVIVTQTEGMNNWLRLQIAAQSGIAANVRFVQPSELIYQLYQILGGPYPDVLAPGNLSWLLYKILSGEEFTKRYPEIASYYNAGGSTDQDLKRLALAEKMADLFDQYQIYRPDMMREWNRNAASTADSADWQQYLWTAARNASRSELPDKTRIGDYILAALTDPEKQQKLKEKLPELHLFGLSITTDYHVQILHEAAKYINLHVHILNPAPEEYWYDDQSEKQLAIWRHKGLPQPEHTQIGNRLLTSWGKIARDTFSMFFQYEAFLNAYEALPAAESVTECLLHKIQEDINTAATTNAHLITGKDLNDGSVTLSSSYTPVREVEALYNYLVHLVTQKDEGIAARDIVVMVSDIDVYAPYIKAIFSNAPYSFRYNIADESYAGGDNLFEALDAVLWLSEDGFKAEEVMQLLELSCIRERFGIDDPTSLRSLVNAANIRFGFDGRSEDDTRFVSWRYGLKRIMYGICMSGEEAFEVEDEMLFPLDLLEGSATQDAIRFCHFIEVLISSIEARRGLRTISDWVRYVEQVIQDLVLEQGDEAGEQHQQLTKKLSDYRVVEEWMPEPISYEIFSRSLLQGLRSTMRSKLYITGGITFCSLIPMRSIPFRVVAMLGLDYDKFPRKERPASFNLMLTSPRRGDRNVRDNDKHLFLETILSAREHLYISYVGRNAKDNTVRPPSAFVDELLDYVARGAGKEPDELRREWVIQHPLHGYSIRYNQRDPRLYNYLGHDKAIPIPRKAAPEALPDELDELRLDELIRFCQHPIRAYYNKVLDIRYERDEILLSDTELFELDKLQKWQFRNDLLELDEAGVIDMLERSRRVGSLPLANMAGVVMDAINEELEAVRSVYHQVQKQGAKSSPALEFQVADTLILGNLDSVFGTTLFSVSWSKSPLKNQLKAYLQLLAGSAAGVLTELWFLDAESDELMIRSGMPAVEASGRLQKLIALYRKGLSEVLPFDVSIAQKSLGKKRAAITEDTFDKAIKSVFDPERGYADEYLHAEYRNGCLNETEAWQRFAALFEILIDPVLDFFTEE
jgi:exodeoxyribonuclease V gamma subunit